MTGLSALIFLCFIGIVRNICFFVHDFWHKAPNSWNFLSARNNQGINSFCYVNKVNFRKPQRMGETNKWLEDWNFQSHPSWPLGMGEGLEVGSAANGQWCNQPCLCNEVSIKTQKDFVQRASRLVGEHVEMWREWHKRKWMEALCPFPHPWPMHFFQQARPKWYSFVISSDPASILFLWVLWAALAN